MLEYHSIIVLTKNEESIMKKKLIGGLLTAAMVVGMNVTAFGGGVDK